jgi:hypothetical protein
MSNCFWVASTVDAFGLCNSACWKQVIFVDGVLQDTVPRGVIKIDRCLSIKGAEDAINRPNAFEISTSDVSMYFIADTEKDKEDWINSVGRAIVRHSRCVMDQENLDYTT